MDTDNFLRAIPRPFGAPNWVTLLRAVFGLALLVCAVVFLAKAWPVGLALRWSAVTGAVIALALDGVDGYLARRQDAVSAFGARFDLETDALLVLSLALMVWTTGQAGLWVLLAGLMRYIFVVGGWLWPVLAKPLPPRRRRQALCVGQIIALIVALAPPVTPLWGSVICLAGLILLGYSFGADLAWLASRPKAESEAV